MRRSILSIAVNAGVFACFVCMIGTGMAMEYLLPSNGGQRAIWGLGRHGWISVHVGLVLLLLLLLAAYVGLHWNGLATVLRGRSREGPGTAIGLVIVLIGLIALAVAPVLSLE